MSSDTNPIVLRYNRTQLDGLQRGGQIWLRAGQIGPAIGYSDERSVRRLYSRHADEFTAMDTCLMVEATAGGPQEVRLFSLSGVRLLAAFARTEPAAKFRRWIMDLMDGRIPNGIRPSGDFLERLEGAPPALSHPMVRAAIDTSLQASAVIAAAFREAREINRQARRQAAQAGVSARELRILVERERWQAKRGSGQLPLLHA